MAVLNPTRVAIVVLVSTVCLPAFGQLPQVRIGSVFPPGGQAGSSVEVSLGSGSDLDEVDRMIFSHSGLTAVPKLDAAGQPVPNVFTVSIAADVPPGLYDVRVAGLFGISNPRAFRVDTLPESVEAEPNNGRSQATPVTPESVINARANGGADVDWYRVPFRAGQTLVMRCESARLDSPMQPVLQLFDMSGRRVSESRRIVSREAVIVWKSARDSDLLLKVFDAVYSGSDLFVYRLAIDSRPQVDWVSPPFVTAGAATTVHVYGRHLPGGEPAARELDGQPVFRSEITLPGSLMLSPNGLAALSGFSDGGWWNGVPGNLLPLSVAGQRPVSEAAETPDQVVTAPFEASGSFGDPRDEDIFRFTAKKDEVWVIETFAQRMGSLADPVLMVEQEVSAGDGSVTWKRVATEDDDRQNPGGAELPTLSDDPSFRLTVPEDGTYRIRLRDRYGATRGDPRLQYRLSVRAPKPDFALVLFDAFPSADGKAPSTSGAASLRKGGTCELSVFAYRRDGHSDPIEVSAADLPPGFSSRTTVIGPGQSSAKLMIAAAEDATEQLAAVRIVGHSGADAGRITREARVATLVHDAINGLPRTARLSESLVAGVMKDNQPFSIQVDSPAAVFTQNCQWLLPVRVIRRDGFSGRIDLSILNVPGETDAPNVAVEEGQDKVFARIYFKEKAPPTTTALQVQGTAQVAYRRNPWLAERAAEHVTTTEAAVAARQAEATAAGTAVTDARAKVELLAAQVQALTEQLAGYATEQHRLRDSFAAALTQHDSAVAGLAAAQSAIAGVDAASAASDEERRQVVSVAAEAAARLAAAAAVLEQQEAASREITTQVAAVKEQIDVAMKQKSDAEAESATRVTEQQTAEAALAAAEKMLADAQAAKTVADDRLKKANESSKPSKVNVRSVSEPLVIEIVPAPAKLTASVPADGAINRGGTLDVKVTITRLNEFTGPVRLELAGQMEPCGLAAEAVDVAAELSEAVIRIAAAADAPLAAPPHLVIQATAELNGRTVTTDVPVVLRIVE